MSKIKRKLIVDGWRLGELESWFSDMAKEGWHLQKRGAIFARFEQGEPKDTRYRIDTSSNKNISTEDKEMFKEAGWEHITKLGEFNVFASPTELKAPELHTNPVEQSYELKDLADKIRKNAITTIIFCAICIALMSAFWFIDKKPTLRFITGDFMPVVLILTILSNTYFRLRDNFSIRALRKKMQEGKAINHFAPWRKNRILTIAVHVFLSALLIVSISIFLVQLTLQKTQTLPAESGDLPIVRLAEIEHDVNLVREEHFVEEQLDMLNQFRYNWSPIAPLQYESDEQGIVSGQLWQDEDVTYSPSIRTQVYRLNFPSLAEKLLADLMRGNIYKGDVIELESDVLDSLFISEEEGSKKVFAAKGKGVMYVAYYGYADAATIISIVEEKMTLIE